MFANVPLTAAQPIARGGLNTYICVCVCVCIYVSVCLCVCVCTPVLFISHSQLVYSPSVSSCKRIMSGQHLMATGQESLLYLRRLDVSRRCGCSHKLLFALIKRCSVDTIGTMCLIVRGALKINYIVFYIFNFVRDL